MLKKIIAAASAILLFATALMAQQPSGGVKGTVVTRGTREPVQNARLELYSGAEILGTVLSAEDGTFMISGLPDGMYTLVITSSEYMRNTVNVTVNDGYVKNMFNLSLTPTISEEVKEEASLTEFDMDDSGYSDSPTILFGSNDIFAQLTSYNWSSIRFKNRGYLSESQDVYLAGVRMNDAVTGYSPYSLWSGLNEATRSKEGTIGNENASVGFSGYNGSTNIFADALSMRTGKRVSVLTNSAFYRLRVMGSYATGLMDNGWAFAVNASARLGGNDWVKGMYYRSFAYYFGVSKVFDDVNRLHLVFMGTPGERGAQNGSTQEVYDLVGDNMYNSNWGYQNGVVRNARVRKTHEPIAILKYEFTPSDDFTAGVTALFRFGKNGYTALDWYNAQDPRPDYYRNLPSYFYNPNPDWNRTSMQKAAWAAEVWSNPESYPEYTQINWDKLYRMNQNDVTADGRRSHYVQQERRTDQRDFNLAGNFRYKLNSFFTLNGGASVRINRTEYFNVLADLLGGDYFLNIDNFADRDFAAYPEMIQNDLDYYNKHGEPQKLKVGDKYGHDYFAYVHNYEGWVNGRYASGNLSANLAARLGYNTFWREGVWKKGLFPDNSQGDSEHCKFFTYAAKAGVNYVIGGATRVYGNVAFYNDAPVFKQAFLSPRTRNSVADNLTTVKTFSTDLNYQYSANGYNVRATAYFTNIADQTDLMSFYDDLQNGFTNFSMSGINQRHMGIEVGFKIPLPVEALALQGALSLGEYVYTSNPRMTQTMDNSAAVVIKNELVPYWTQTPIYARDADGNITPEVERYQKHYVSSTPQTAASLGLSWNKNYWFIDADVEYFDRSYLDMNPLYRTDRATAGADGIVSPQEIEYMTSQERFKPAFLVNLSIGKSWFIRYKYQFGVNLNAKNLLNNTNIRTGGYEQNRIVENTTSKTSYYRFDPRYFYYAGFNYMLNVYFRF